MFQKLAKAPEVLRRVVNLWPPFLGAGISVESLASDFSEAVISLKMRYTNKNYVGVHYGGSLYSMCDPFYMLLVMNRLGKEFIVWDKAAEIEFKKPGKGTVKAHFKVDDAMLEDIRKNTQNGEKYLPVYSVDVVDERGEVVATVNKTLYIKRK
jgi:acyl-coenzyme A thioesterase PaaI-like protein